MDLLYRIKCHVLLHLYNATSAFIIFPLTPSPHSLCSNKNSRPPPRGTSPSLLSLPPHSAPSLIITPYLVLPRYSPSHHLGCTISDLQARPLHQQKGRPHFDDADYQDSHLTTVCFIAPLFLHSKSPPSSPLQVVVIPATSHRCRTPLSIPIVSLLTISPPSSFFSRHPHFQLHLHFASESQLRLFPPHRPARRSPLAVLSCHSRSHPHLAAGSMEKKKRIVRLFLHFLNSGSQFDEKSKYALDGHQMLDCLRGERLVFMGGSLNLWKRKGGGAEEEKTGLVARKRERVSDLDNHVAMKDEVI